MRANEPRKYSTYILHTNISEKFLKFLSPLFWWLLSFYSFEIADINECEFPNMQDVCPFGCENSVGSYRCKEAPPSSPDSEVESYTTEAYTTERSAPVKTCGSGMILDATNNCIDIDECAEGNTGCENCQNTIGSFICTCPIGFQLSSDERTCR